MIKFQNNCFVITIRKSKDSKHICSTNTTSVYSKHGEMDRKILQNNTKKTYKKQTDIIHMLK